MPEPDQPKDQVLRSWSNQKIFLQKLLDAVPVGIAWVEEGVILMCNLVLARMLGYDCQEVQGLEIASLFCSHQDYLRAFGLEERGGGQPALGAMDTCWQGHGPPIEVRLQVTGLPTHGGAIGFMVSVEDITARKIAEKTLREYQDRFLQLSSELSLAEERQRQRLAEAVHDSLGQTLALLRIGLKRALATQPGHHQSRLLELVSLVDHAFGEVRSITTELDPQIPLDKGLDWGLTWLVENTIQRHGIPTLYHPPGAPLDLDHNLSILLFRMVQELVINAVKHGAPRQIMISLTQTGQELEVMVQDDGCGFEAGNLRLLKPPHFGLHNIAERVKALGGSFKVGSRPGVGTAAVITITLPEGG